jgi:hypothetical protein
MPLRKLRYVPGLVSLIGLPILFFIYPVEDPPVHQTVLAFRIPAYTGNPGSVATDKVMLEWIKRKKLTRIYLLDMQADSEIKSFQQREKFKLINEELRKMAFNGDTSVALQIEFGFDNSYGEWVAIQNLCLTYGILRYQFIGDSYYIAANLPAETIVPQCFELNMEDYPRMMTGPENKEPGKWELFLDQLSYKWKDFVYVVKQNLNVVIPFILLIILPSIIWIRQNRKRKFFAS